MSPSLVPEFSCNLSSSLVALSPNTYGFERDISPCPADGFYSREHKEREKTLMYIKHLNLYNNFHFNLTGKQLDRETLPYIP